MPRNRGAPSEAPSDGHPRRDTGRHHAGRLDRSERRVDRLKRVGAGHGRADDPASRVGRRGAEPNSTAASSARDRAAEFALDGLLKVGTGVGDIDVGDGDDAGDLLGLKLAADHSIVAIGLRRSPRRTRPRARP